MNLEKKDAARKEGSAFSFCFILMADHGAG